MKDMEMETKSGLRKAPEVGRTKRQTSRQFAADLHKICSPHSPRVPSAHMVIKLLQTGFVGLFLCIASAWAGPSSIQGVVKDAKGQAIKGADVRVESRDGKQLFNTVKTDAKGRYVSQDLTPGVYRVSLMVNGAVKASITNTKTNPDQATLLNFDLKPVSAAKASAEQKKGKHMVWVPTNTGTHIGGRWVEVDETSSADASNLNVKRASAEALRREQLQRTGGLPPTASGATGGGP